MRNIMVAQSGGPTVAINASLAGVISGASEYGFGKVFGAVHGILGVLNENFVNLTEAAKDSEFIPTLTNSPSMYLGSCRYRMKEASDDSSDYKKIFDVFEKYEIDAFLYIGGNDSMDTVMKVSKYGKENGYNVAVVGIPKTIDNDLMATDHTPGFGSAAKYIATTMLEIAHDTFIYPVKSVTIVEIMGRDAGWLTAASCLARNEYSTAPHLIYLPEVPFDTETFVEDVKEVLRKVDNCIVAVSEGVRDDQGQYISASGTAVDNFGHSQLSGAGKTLEYIIRDELGVKVRSIEVNVLQRAAAHMASLTDIEEATSLGKKAVELAANGVTSAMTIIRRESSSPYVVSYSSEDISGIANEAKSVPVEWINAAGNDVTEEMVEYLAPLIVGETPVVYENGLPRYAKIPHLNVQK